MYNISSDLWERGTMDKDIQNINKEIFNLLRCYSMIATPNEILNKYTYYSDDMSSNRFKNNKIYELIVLIRIERLFDLGEIDEDTKNLLTNLYKQYRIVYDKLGNDLREGFKNVDKIQHSSYRRKLNVISDKLNEYGLLDEFDFESAFMNEIDSKILKKIKSN